MIRTWPRLPTKVAGDLLRDLTKVSEFVDPLHHAGQPDHALVTWYPTAARVEPSRVTEVRRVVIEVARRHGYPRALASRSPQARAFDQAVGSALYGAMDITPVDAAQEGVWSFVSLVLLPDVALWRWPNTRELDDYERLIGRPRNVFRRLWWRAYILGPELSEELLEDEAVAIMERPTIGSDPRLARSIARHHLDACKREPGASRSEIMRQTAKRLRRLSPIVAFAALDDDQLDELVAEVVGASIAALVSPGPTPAQSTDELFSQPRDGPAQVVEEPVRNPPGLVVGSARSLSCWVSKRVGGR